MKIHWQKLYHPINCVFKIEFFKWLIQIKGSHAAPHIAIPRACLADPLRHWSRNSFTRLPIPFVALPVQPFINSQDSFRGWFEMIQYHTSTRLSFIAYLRFISNSSVIHPSPKQRVLAYPLILHQTRKPAQPLEHFILCFTVNHGGHT